MHVHTITVTVVCMEVGHGEPRRVGKNLWTRKGLKGNYIAEEILCLHMGYPQIHQVIR